MSKVIPNKSTLEFDKERNRVLSPHVYMHDKQIQCCNKTPLHNWLLTN